MDDTVGRAGQWRRVELTPLTDEECWALLRTHSIGRVAVMVGGRPEIFPVNYGAGSGAIVFRSAPGTKLTNLPMTQTSFEIDGWDDRTGSGWSVMVHGTVSELTGAIDDLALSLHRLPVHPLAPGDRDHWLAIYADEVTGRRFTSGPMAPEVT